VTTSEGLIEIMNREQGKALDTAGVEA